MFQVLTNYSGFKLLNTWSSNLYKTKFYQNIDKYPDIYEFPFNIHILLKVYFSIFLYNFLKILLSWKLETHREVENDYNKLKCTHVLDFIILLNSFKFPSPHYFEASPGYHFLSQ